MSARDEFAVPARRAHYYGGGWHGSSSDATIAVENPATGERLGEVAAGGTQDVERAVSAARNAFPGWRDTPVQERARLIRTASAILREHAEELAWLDAVDGGNPLQAMLFDVGISAAYMDYFAGLVTEMHGATIPVGPAC